MTFPKDEHWGSKCVLKVMCIRYFDISSQSLGMQGISPLAPIGGVLHQVCRGTVISNQQYTKVLFYILLVPFVNVNKYIVSQHIYRLSSHVVHEQTLISQITPCTASYIMGNLAHSLFSTFTFIFNSVYYIMI